MKIKTLGFLLVFILAFSLVLAPSFQSVKIASALDLLFDTGLESGTLSEFTGQDLFYGNKYNVSDLAAFSGNYGWRCQSTLGYWGLQGGSTKILMGQSQRYTSRKWSSAKTQRSQL